MAITSYKDLVRFSSQIKIGDSFLSDIIEDLDIVKNQPFICKHSLFYPKGVFSEKYLDAYFFDDNNIHIIKFRNDVTSIKTIKLDQITSVNLDVHEYEEYVLLIKFSNEEDIILNAKEDSNVHNKRGFSENIAKIHKYLLTRNFDSTPGTSSDNL